MPGRDKIVYAGLELEVIPSGKERGIYFTDEKPIFYLKIHNLTGKRVRGQLSWFYGFGAGVPEHMIDDVIDFDIYPKQIIKKEIMGKLLGFQGNGVIGIPTPPEKEVLESENANERVFKPASEDFTKSLISYETLYTFTVMDRDFYRRVYEYPVNIQKLTMMLTVILIFLTLYTVAKDSVSNPMETSESLFLATIYGIVSVSSILIGYYAINRLIKGRK